MLTMVNDWITQYLKNTKAALRGKKQLVAGEDQYGGAHDEDGSAASRTEDFRNPVAKRRFRKSLDR